MRALIQILLEPNEAGLEDFRSLAITGQVLTFRTSEPHSGKNSEHSPPERGWIDGSRTIHFGLNFVI